MGDFCLLLRVIFRCELNFPRGLVYRIYYLIFLTVLLCTDLCSLYEYLLLLRTSYWTLYISSIYFKYIYVLYLYFLDVVEIRELRMRARIFFFYFYSNCKKRGGKKFNSILKWKSLQIIMRNICKYYTSRNIKTRIFRINLRRQQTE